jgi:cell division initiation protein
MSPPITPLELRKRVFQKKMRGYDVQEVSHFLEALAEDLEDVFRRLDELERENDRLKDENAHHRGTENSLKETLLMAQRSAESLLSTTEKEADRRLRDAERQADLLMQQGMERVSETEKKIRDLRLERRNFHLKLQGMLDMFQQVLNFDREEDELDSSVAVLKRAPRGHEGRGPGAA